MAEELATDLTEDDAVDQVEAYLRSAIEALPDEPELRALREGRRPCPDPLTGEDGPTVTVGRGYWLLGLDAARNHDYLTAIRTYWAESGFLVTGDTSPAERFVSVEHEDDGFRMSVVVSDAGVLSISASSPCAAPSLAGE